jgi:hypothetical protein
MAVTNWSKQPSKDFNRSNRIWKLTPITSTSQKSKSTINKNSFKTPAKPSTWTFLPLSQVISIVNCYLQTAELPQIPMKTSIRIGQLTTDLKLVNTAVHAWIPLISSGLHNAKGQSLLVLIRARPFHLTKLMKTVWRDFLNLTVNYLPIWMPLRKIRKVILSICRMSDQRKSFFRSLSKQTKWLSRGSSTQGLTRQKLKVQDHNKKGILWFLVLKICYKRKRTNKSIK